MLQYIVFSLFIIAGLGITILQEGWGKSYAGLWAYPYLSQISSTLLVGGTLSLLYKIFVDRDAERRLRQLLRIHDSIDICGLKEIFLDSKDYNFSDFLRKAETVEIVMNDGNRWVGNYSVELSKRFSRQCTTIFYFINPQSKFAEALAVKVGSSIPELRGKIEKTELTIKDIYEKSGKRGALKIYYLKNYPTQSIFSSKDSVIITPYQTSGGRRAVPLFVYEDNGDERCYAKDVKKDLANVQAESEIIFNK